MNRRLVCFVLLVILAPEIFAQVDAQMLQNPDVSQNEIVFTYAGDLWVVAKEGGTASRLSSPRGQELFARFSPDGSRIAYSANYDGNMELYVVPTRGGVPARVTWHGMNDRLLDWYPDGKRLLFATAMNSGRQRFSQFYCVPAGGGLPERLPVPYGEMGAISSDGKKIAYTPVTQAFRTWKRYRGGWAADIILFDLEKEAAENITAHVASDEFPMWHGSTLFFLSDRGPDNRANIWACDLITRKTRQVTQFADYDIHFPAIGPADIVFEAGGKLYRLTLADEKIHEVKVKVVTDEITLLPRIENAVKYIQHGTISPDGKRVIVEARGELFSVPAENGPVINLTRSPGTAERYPSWSPDGRSIACWSDKSGEYELTIIDLTRPGSEKKMTSYGPGYRYTLFWSPDNKKIAFIDKAMAIQVYDLESSTTTKIDNQLFYFQGGLDAYRVSWSPDSRWLAYAREIANRNSAIVLYDFREKKSTQVTSGYYTDLAPSFDPDGKYLYFLTNRTLKPVYSDLDGTWIYPNTTSIAAATLTDTLASPLAPKNDTTAVKKAEQKKEEVKPDEKKGEKKEEKPKDTPIMLAGFEKRVVMLPPAAGNIGTVQGVSGKVVFHRLPNSGSADKKKPLIYFDLDKREEKTIIEDTDVFMLSADGKKVLVGKAPDLAVVEIAENQKIEKKIPVTQMEMTVDPRAEWRQIFTEVWRLERDFFYDPNMHGVDWEAIRDQYGKLLASAVTRWDVNYIIGELIAELNASHTYRGGGDEEQAGQRPFGYLGIDWELKNGAYAVKKIITGAPWDSEVRSPLDEPGLKINEGEYILAVNGEPLDVKKAPWASFAGLADKSVELMISPVPSMDRARKVVVKLLADESRLRHLAWIETNRRRVDAASGGRVGYIYVPDTGTEGQTELVRQFDAQFTKEGLIIDERFNSGGQIPDRFIELLNRKPLAYFAVRDGQDWQWPWMANFGPKVMLINGWSGSGGDAFPDYFRKAGLGPLIGTRTWGGLIGISGAPTLVDGGNVTVPTLRMYNPDGTWFKEGYGVDPDIMVEDDPAKLAQGVDPQLERAIEEVLNRLRSAPAAPPKRPAYEKR